MGTENGERVTDGRDGRRSDGREDGDRTVQGAGGGGCRPGEGGWGRETGGREGRGRAVAVAVPGEKGAVDVEGGFLAFLGRWWCALRRLVLHLRVPHAECRPVWQPPSTSSPLLLWHVCFAISSANSASPRQPPRLGCRRHDQRSSLTVFERRKGERRGLTILFSVYSKA